MSDTKEKPAAEGDSKGKKFLAGIKRIAVKAARFLLIPALLAWAGYTIYQDPPAAGRYLAAHLGIVLWAVLGILILTGRNMESRARMTAILAPAKSKRKRIKDPMQSTPTAVSEWIELAFFRDAAPWRVIQVLVLAAAVWIVTTKPLVIADFMPPDVIEWERVGIILAAPFLWIGVLALRVNPTMKKRHATIKAIYNIANSSMKFPRPNVRPTGEQVRLQDPFRVVKVKEWETLDLPRRFHIEGPTNMSVTDTKAWEEFMENLDAKVQHPEGWHLDKDRTGTSADVYPAQYPMSVLWKGEHDPDPLVFLAGADLDNPGEWSSFTFGETSPHIMITGGTGSGKSSFAEIVLAQAGIKPMPWDPTLFADCHIIDPKGPFANRWEHRPNMTVTNGAIDLPDEMGDVQSGVVAMAMHAEKLLAELERRSGVQQGFKGVATWIDLPDEVKKSEKLRPVIIVMDEFLDHVTQDSSKSEQAEVENAARDRIVYITGMIARKGRSLGLHVILIAQDGKMTDIGSSLVRQMVARGVMGNMDRTAMARMFGEGAELGILPTSRLVNGRLKGIPGRGRLMNAPGQALRRIQVAWFGGRENLDALDKFLPRNAEKPEPRDSAEDLTDEDGNGIPDNWENLPTAGTLRMITEAEFDALIEAPRPAPTAPVAVAEPSEDETTEAVDEAKALESHVVATDPEKSPDEDAQESAGEPEETPDAHEQPELPLEGAEPTPEQPAVPTGVPDPDPLVANTSDAAKTPDANPFAAAARAKASDPAPTTPTLDVSQLFGSGRPRP